MKLVFALGNPEPKYANTRHNVGFFIADEYAKKQGVDWQNKTKFKAQIAESSNCIIAKPQTYYNLVGESTRAIANFYKIAPQDILIIHDDIALPFGTVRTRLGGSPAGNNGIKSLNQHMGENTARLRIGTWNELVERTDTADFVLSKFTAKEQASLNQNLPVIFEVIDSFLTNKFKTTTHR